MSDIGRSKEVEPGNWEQATGLVSLEVEAMGGSIGVAVFDSEGRRGFTSHILSVREEGLGHGFAEAVQTAAIPASLEYWVRGGEHVSELESREEAESDRQTVLDSLEALSIAGIDVVWTEVPDTAVEMQLDCSTGECHTKVVRMPFDEPAVDDGYTDDFPEA